jgi:hypothetical protein
MISDLQKDPLQSTLSIRTPDEDRRIKDVFGRQQPECGWCCFTTHRAINDHRLWNQCRTCRCDADFKACGLRMQDSL